MDQVEEVKTDVLATRLVVQRKGLFELLTLLIVVGRQQVVAHVFKQVNVSLVLFVDKVLDRGYLAGHLLLIVKCRKFSKGIVVGNRLTIFGEG